MDEEKIRDAFKKIKEDMDFLNSEILSLKKNLVERDQELSVITKNMLKSLPLLIKQDSTNRSDFQTDPTNFPTDNSSFRPLNRQNLSISTGNDGVPTDRQTDRQIDRQTSVPNDLRKNSIEKAAEILDSLDYMKKEIRLKFKRLTEKEFLVFSTIYQMEETGFEVDYKSVSQRLNLTESSIRDYVGKLIKKGISIDKSKVNNKQVLLSIPPSLKKITPLSTILKLRDL